MELLIMRNDNIVATVDSGVITSLTEDAPILIKGNRFEDWKAIRVQDLNRPNSRALRRLLGLSTSKPQDVLPAIYYQSLSDAYWMKEAGCATRWTDIQFKDDRFFHITLTGKNHFSNPAIFQKKESPEHSNTGSFEKGWKMEADRWQLWKAGNREAIWSEVFYSNLANLIFPGCAVKYWCEDGFSVCDNFIDRDKGESLEPFFSLHDDHSNSETALALLPECVHEEYRNMLFLDALMYNWDRHEFNFGLVTRTGMSEVKLQPYYDFNLALWNGATAGVERFEDPTIRMFKAVKTNIPLVVEDMIKTAYEQTETPFPAVATLKDTTEFIMKSYALL
jgi:hypothetical protein